MQDLLRAHGPSIGQSNLVNCEYVRQHAPLRLHIVPMAEWRKTPHPVRFRNVGRRGRQAVAEHVWNDDEPIVRVQNFAGANQPLDIRVVCAIRCGIQNDIGTIRRQLAIGLVGQLSLGQYHTALQMQITQIKDFLFVHVHPFLRISYRQHVERSNMIRVL